jgi:hypothetical protein
LRQNQPAGADLQFIPDREPPTGETLHRVTEQLQDLLKVPGVITTESVKMLPPLPSGKFRLTLRAEG